MKTATKPPRNDEAIAKLPRVAREFLLPFGGSLYLKRRPNGRQTWVLRTRIGGAWQVRQLGDWPAVGMHLARQRAEDGRIDLKPTLPDNTVEHALATFEREYIGTRYRTADARKESGAMLKKAVAGFANRTLSGLRLLDLTAAVQRLADRPNTAAKSLALLKQFTGWCKARGLMDIDPLSGVTAKHLGMQAYEPRERVLTPDELRDLWRRADTDARVLKFCALTACRIGEALQWQAGQVVDGVWTIPMTKNGKAHVLPLSPAAIALLPLPGTPPAYTSMIQRMKAAGLTWRPHDIRRTAATLMRSAGVPVHDIEATLNHDAPKLVRVYQRHDPLDEKRAALVALAKRLDETVKGAK